MPAKPRKNKTAVGLIKGIGFKLEPKMMIEQGQICQETNGSIFTQPRVQDLMERIQRLGPSRKCMGVENTVVLSLPEEGSLSFDIPGNLGLPNRPASSMGLLMENSTFFCVSQCVWRSHIQTRKSTRCFVWCFWIWVGLKSLKEWPSEEHSVYRWWASKII